MPIDPEDGSARDQWARYLLAGLIIAGFAMGLWFYLGRQPQMGTSEEAFKTVDALYTAIRNHDENRMADCEKRLKNYRENGNLPPAAADLLDSVITRARAGSWDIATQKLYDFMMAQRRDGPAESPNPAKKSVGPIGNHD